MTARLYLIRHGETDWNRMGRLQGQTDVGLSPEGRQQVQALAQRMAALNIAAIYASDLVRAHETARLLADAHPSRPALNLDPRLREVDVGRVAGLTIGEIRDREPDLYHQLIAVGAAAVDFPGGEGAEAVQLRALAALSDIVARHPTEAVAVITHGVVIKLITCQVLGIPRDRLGRFRLWNCSITCVAWPKLRDPQLLFLNDFAHLEAVGLARPAM